MDVKWADGVYDKDKEGPEFEGWDAKAELVKSLAAGPSPVTVAVEDILHFRPASSLKEGPAVAVALDKPRQLILVVVRGTSSMSECGGGMTGDE